MPCFTHLSSGGVYSPHGIKINVEQNCVYSVSALWKICVSFEKSSPCLHGVNLAKTVKEVAINVRGLLWKDVARESETF